MTQESPLSESTEPPARRPGQRRVMIVEDDTLVGMGLRGHLEKLGHVVVGQAADAEHAVALFQSHKPDLVLMDIRLSNTDGIELASLLLQIERVPMIVVSAFSDAELIARAAAVGVFGYLIKPATREALAAQIAVASLRFEENEDLRNEKDVLEQTLESRKVVERAKGILMKRHQLDEPDAHRRLQIQSQNLRINIAEVAKKIIESEKMAGGT